MECSPVQIWAKDKKSAKRLEKSSPRRRRNSMRMYYQYTERIKYFKEDDASFFQILWEVRQGKKVNHWIWQDKPSFQLFLWSLVEKNPNWSKLRMEQGRLIKILTIAQKSFAVKENREMEQHLEGGSVKKFCFLPILFFDTFLTNYNKYATSLL